MEQLEEKVYCSSCKQKTNHNIIHTYEENSHDFEGPSWYARYHIVQCAGCERIAFVTQHGDEEDWEYVNGQRVWIDKFNVYPEEPPEESSVDIFEKKFFLKQKSYINVPENLYALYKQIIDSYNLKHNILCASGLRTLIEGICKELDVTKGYIYEADRTKKIHEQTKKEILTSNLAGRIFGLYEQGYILFPQALILQKIKLIGNDAIHDIISPDVFTLREVIRIVERIIYDIYELGKHNLLQE